MKYFYKILSWPFQVLIFLIFVGAVFVALIQRAMKKSD